MMRHHLHMPSYFLGTFTEYPYILLLFVNRFLLVPDSEIPELVEIKINIL